MEGEPDAGLPLALDEPIHKVGAFSPTSRSSSSGPDRCVRSCVLYASRSPLSGSDPKVPSRPPSSNEMVRIDKAAYCGRARRAGTGRSRGRVAGAAFDFASTIQGQGQNQLWNRTDSRVG